YGRLEVRAHQQQERRQVGAGPVHRRRTPDRQGRRARSVRSTDRTEGRRTARVAVQTGLLFATLQHVFRALRDEGRVSFCWRVRWPQRSAKTVGTAKSSRSAGTTSVSVAAPLG